MKVYKYRVVKTPKELNESKLNAFGRQGWRLVCSTSNDIEYTYYFITGEEESNG